MMLAVLVAAGLLGLTRTELGFVLTTVALLIAIITVSVWLLTRRRRRLALACWITTVALVNISVGLSCIYAPRMLDGAFTLLATLITTPIALGLGAAWAQSATSPDAVPRRSLPFAWFRVLILATLLPTMFTHWPHRLAFLASRPSLNRLADRVSAGQLIQQPEWAGLFWIVGSDLDLKNGNIALITDLNPGGRSGLVRLGTNNPTNPLGPLVNLSTDEALDGRWRCQEED
jgi:hypothetical protein